MKSSRIELIDALRGFALMGMFFVHMVSFYGLYMPNENSAVIFQVVGFLFSGKSYAIFALLFGYSFFIIMNNQAQRGIDFRARFCLRLSLLFLFGYLHALVYFAEIITSLSVFGLVLIALYRVKTTTLLIITFIFIFQIPNILWLFSTFVGLTSVETNPKFWAAMGPASQVWTEGSFLEVVKINSWQTWKGIWYYGLESGRGSIVLGMMLLGFVLARISLFNQLDKYANKINIVGMVGLLAAFLLLYIESLVQASPLEGIRNFILTNVITNVKNTGAVLFGFSLFIYLWKNEYAHYFLAKLKYCGRMTLTLYIFQSLMCVPLFYGYGLALAKTATHFHVLLITLVLWLFQLVFAYFWLQYFKQGPLEWLLRKGTYIRTNNIDKVNELKI